MRVPKNQSVLLTVKILVSEAQCVSRVPSAASGHVPVMTVFISHQ